MDEGVDTKATSFDILHDLVNRIALHSSACSFIILIGAFVLLALGVVTDDMISPYNEPCATLKYSESPLVGIEAPMAPAHVELDPQRTPVPRLHVASI